MFTSHWLVTRDDDLWSPLVETIYDVNTTELSTRQNDKPNNTEYSLHHFIYSFWAFLQIDKQKFFLRVKLKVKRDQKRFNTGRTDERVSQIILRDISLTIYYPKTSLRLYVPDLQLLLPTWNFFGGRWK